jgi:RimJ/RimL family protein N-acetyltransferase
MSFLETIAANMRPVTKVMLTCFVANKAGIEFYRRLGFRVDPASASPKELRSGRITYRDYVIMSKSIRRGRPDGETTPERAQKASEVK